MADSNTMEAPAKGTKVRQDKQSAKATREGTQLSVCAPSSSSDGYYVSLFCVCALEGTQKEAVLGLGEANVEVEVTFEGDVVAVLLSVHDGGAGSDEASVLIIGEGLKVSYGLVELPRSQARL